VAEWGKKALIIMVLCVGERRCRLAAMNYIPYLQCALRYAVKCGQRQTHETAAPDFSTFSAFHCCSLLSSEIADLKLGG